MLFAGGTGGLKVFAPGILQQAYELHAGLLHAFLTAIARTGCVAGGDVTDLQRGALAQFDCQFLTVLQRTFLAIDDKGALAGKVELGRRGGPQALLDSNLASRVLQGLKVRYVGSRRQLTAAGRQSLFQLVQCFESGAQSLTFSALLLAAGALAFLAHGFIALVDLGALFF